MPFSSSVYLATEAILAAGSEEQKKKYLPQLAAGELIGTFALAEGAKVPTAKNQETQARGRQAHRREAPGARRRRRGLRDRGRELAATGPRSRSSTSRASGVKREAVATFDPTRSHARVRFDGAPAELLGADGKGWALKERSSTAPPCSSRWSSSAAPTPPRDVGRLRARAATRSAGRSRRSRRSSTSSPTCTSRTSWRARTATTARGRSQTSAKELPVAAARRAISATQAYHFASKENIQIHGGIGFTWEYDCHLFYRRAKLLSLVLGSAHSWKDRLDHASREAGGRHARPRRPERAQEEEDHGFQRHPPGSAVPREVRAWLDANADGVKTTGDSVSTRARDAARPTTSSARKEWQAQEGRRRLRLHPLAEGVRRRAAARSCTRDLSPGGSEATRCRAASSTSASACAAP